MKLDGAPSRAPLSRAPVIMPPGERAIRGVDDSKQLTAAERESWWSRFASGPSASRVGAASVREIDRVNIYHATVLAMRRALTRLSRAAAPRAHRWQADPHTRHRAHRDRRRRRRVLLDRLRVDRREGHARPLDALRLRRATRTTAGRPTSATRRRRISRASARPVSRRTIAGRSCRSASSPSTSVGSRTSAPTKRSASKSMSPRSRCSSRRTSTRRQSSCDSPRRAPPFLGAAIRWSSRLPLAASVSGAYNRSRLLA